MGQAVKFITEVSARTPGVAFEKARRQAIRENGNSILSGTIAPKSEYTMINLLPGQDPYAVINEMLYDITSPFFDKWGPCGCIKMPRQIEHGPKGRINSPSTYIFFGWAPT